MHRRIHRLVFLSTCVSLLAACAAQGPAAPPSAADADPAPSVLPARDLVEEVRATAEAARAVAEATGSVDASLRTIAERLTALEPALDAALSREDDNRRGPNLPALRKIVLPPDPSAEQVEAYIRAIGVATQGQRQRGNNDPQIAMIADAGRHHLEPLLAALGMSDMMDHYLLQAIRIAATDGEKMVVLNHLVRKPQLIEVVNARGWWVEAKPMLLAEVRNGRALTDRGWLNTLARARDAELDEVLVQSFVEGPNRPAIFQTIQHQRGLDLEFVVAEAWAKARLGTPQERMQLAPIAVAWGSEEALQLVIDALPPTPQPGQHHGWHGPYGDLRSTALIHLDFYGTNEEIREWYKQNRERLRFDPQKRRFRVIPEAEAETGPEETS